MMNQPNTNELPALVDRLVQIGKIVAEDFTTARSAHAESSDVSGRLLDEIVMAIADALPAICGPAGFMKLIGTRVSTLYVTTDGIFLAGLAGDEADVASRFEMGDDSTLEPLDTRTAAERFGLVDILRALVDQLETQLPTTSRSTGRLAGGRAASTARYEKQTAIARAAIVLLRKGEP